MSRKKIWRCKKDFSLKKILKFTSLSLYIYLYTVYTYSSFRALPTVFLHSLYFFPMKSCPITNAWKIYHDLFLNLHRKTMPSIFYIFYCFPYKFKSFLGIGLQGFFSGSTLTYDSIYSWLCAKSANASLSVISYIFFETLREFVNYLCMPAMDLSHSFLSIF